MNDLDSASIDPAGGARPATTMASSLSTIVDRFGPGAFFKPEEVRLLLRQDWPDSNREIDLLLAALADGIPQRLLAAHDDAALRDVLPQSVDRLIRNPSFDPTTAMWAVRTWAIALALPVSGIDGARVAGGRPAAQLAASLAAVVTPLAGPRRDGLVPGPIEAPAVERPVPAAPVPPAIVVPPRSAPRAVAQATASPTGPVPSPPVAPPEATAPVPPRPAAPAASTSQAPRVDPEPAAPDRSAGRRTFPWKSAIAAVVMIFIAVGAWIVWRQIAVAPGRSSTVAGALTTTPAPSPAPSPDTSPISRPAPPASEPERAASSPSTPASTPRAETTPAPPTEAMPSASSVTPTLAPPTTPPAAAVAGSPEPPTIAHIDVPRIAQGKPFLVAVSVVDRPERVASVERRTGAGASGRLAPFVANAVTTLTRTPSGAWLVPFRAIDQPGPVTVEFALVDRSGVRGPPRRVELIVVASAVAPQIPAASSTIARAPCSRATCGSVVSVRTLDAPGAVELIVRMDDRSIQTVRQTGRWIVGSRVQRVDERYVPIATE